MDRKEIDRIVESTYKLRASELKGLEGLFIYPDQYDGPGEISDSYPIISSDSCICKYLKGSICNFVRAFYSKYSYLADINFNNILIAGGAITCIFRDEHIEDLDIFFYGISPQDAQARMEELIILIQNVFIGHRFAYVKNRYTLTLRIDDLHLEFQFIFRCYNSISEILHSFDNGSSAIGFDGQRLYVTELGHLAMKYGFNVVDLTKRNLTYERRLVKYFNRGFSIMMPNLDISKLTSLNKIVFGNMYIDIKEIEGNIIHSSCYAEKNPIDIHANLGYSLHHSDNSAVNYINIINVFKDKYLDLIYTSRDFLDLPKLNIKAITTYYDQLMNEIYTNTNLNITQLKRLNPDVDVAKFIRIIVDQNDQVWNDLIAQRKAQIEEYILSPKATYKINWIDSEQDLLTSMFTCIYTDPKEWYGNLYIQ